MISECRNLAMLRKSLATLPRTLDQTYDRILTAINENDRMYTIRILQWLTFSARPLYLKEVAELVAIDIAREPAFDPDEVLMDPLEALDICSSLVIITKDHWNRQMIALAHYSVQEYLVSERIRQGPAKQYNMEEIECHKAMTIGCLGYLNRFQEPLTDDIYFASALARYSAEFWSDHLQKTGDGEEEMSRLAMSLLLTEKHVLANSIRIFDPETHFSYKYRSGEEPIATPLYYASFLGLTTITKLLLDQDVDVNAQIGEHGSPLYAAVAGGHLAVVELLVNAKFDVNIEDQFGETALHRAINLDEKAIAKVLINAGADVNTRDQDQRSALHIASSKGDEEVLRLLIRAGADVNAPGSEYFGHALLAAAEGGHSAVVELLLDEGAEIDAQHAKWGSALHGAVRSSQETTMEVLLRRGASVALDRQSKGVLYHAIASPRYTPSIFRMLKEFSAPLNTIDIRNMTPLHYCVVFEHEAIAKQLIDAGVPIDSTVRRRAWPSRAGKSRDSQADTTFIASTSITVGLTPLHFATLNGKVRMTKFLLEHGADPNALSEHGETPLHLALRARILGHKFEDDWDQVDWRTTYSQKEILNVLMADPRTSLTAVDTDGESCLHCVCYGEPESAIVVQRLLSRGADPCSVNSSQYSPLRLAIQAGDHESVRTLLSMGANVAPTYRNSIKVLHDAAHVRNHDVIVALLESEQAKADMLITSKDKNGRNVLHHMFLVEWHEVKTVQWLLDHGAGGSEPDNFGVSPLAQYLKSSLPLHADICRSLLSTKEAASVVGHEGQTLGHFSATRFNFEVPILNVLKEGGVDLTERDYRGRTILHYAVLYNTLTEQVLGYLLNVIGIKADDQDAQGRTALQYALKTADAYCARDSLAFKRWERTLSMLRELQERKRVPLRILSGSSDMLSSTSLPLNPNANRMQ